MHAGTLSDEAGGQVCPWAVKCAMISVTTCIATINRPLVVCPSEDIVHLASKPFRRFMLKPATRGDLCSYLTRTAPPPYVAQREGGVIKETLIAAGRSCSSVWLFSLGVLCMTERKHSKWHQRASGWRSDLFLLCSSSPSKYLLIRLETVGLRETWQRRSYRRMAWH